MQKIIHVDMDCFYAAVEMRDNPSLKNVPIAVGSKGARGVLSTSNYIARQFGVRSAMPNAKALKLCPELVIVNGRMNVYRETSIQIREIFKRYTDLVEPLSLDEAYLDVSDSFHFYGSATLIAQQIRQDIYTELNLTASAGIAPNKFLAKIASDENKPNGQCVITPNNVNEFIKKMPLSKIPGVGKVTYEKLKAHGLVCGLDVINYDKASLINQFGKLGISLWDKCQGIDNRAVITSRIPKSVGVERTFSQNTNSFEELSRYMYEKLIPELKNRAEHHLKTRNISKLGVKVKFNDFHQTTKEFKQDYFDDTLFEKLLQEALSRGEGKSVRLLGVHIGLAEQANEQQQYEFEW